MRLHSLEVTAFGPFAGTETVDFDALAVGGVFLFTGSTGAGKTSLLDAVCFALYGQVPGARARPRAACAATTPPTGSRPEVVLEADAARPADADHPVTRLGAPEAPRLRHRRCAGRGAPRRAHRDRVEHALDPARRGRRPGRAPPRPAAAAVLPGRPAAPGSVRRLPARGRREPSRPAGEPLRHRALHRGGALAGRPAPGVVPGPRRRRPAPRPGSGPDRRGVRAGPARGRVRR